MNTPRLEDPHVPATHGRRHARDGSIPVIELLSRQSPPLGPIARTELDELLDGADPDAATGAHRKPPSKGSQIAKLAGLGVATLVLCGSVAAASMIARHRADDTAAAGRPTDELIGERALLPDHLDRSIPPSRETAATSMPNSRTGSPADRGRTAAAASPPAPRPSTEQRPSPPTASTTTSSRQHDTTQPQVSDRELVEEYYRLASTEPSSAFDLLDADLLGTSLGEFLQSWSVVRQVRLLNVMEQGDDVLAVVRMTLADGSHLRVRQLLQVDEQQIVGAQVLSAQRN